MFASRQVLRLLTGALLLLGVAFATGMAPTNSLAAEQERPQLVPPAAGQRNNVEIWRAVRQGVRGTVSIPDKKAGVLVQSEGENWRALRNGPLSTYGVWLLIGTVAVLALFFAVRGRIRIQGGWSGTTVVRFAGFERLVHWTTAVSFIVLALTGLNVLYGRYVLLPVMGGDAFADVTAVGKYLHDYVGLLFILGLVLMFVCWIRDNIPDRTDLIWLVQGGGLFSKSSHPPARKFNAGQKIVFAGVILIGGLISFTGINLLFPFSFGFDVQDMQLAQLLHSLGALVLTALILAHIYIGTIGMEGAIDAMWTGEVDANWAREHHSLWVEELDAETDTGAATAPAE